MRNQKLKALVLSVVLTVLSSISLQAQRSKEKEKGVQKNVEEVFKKRDKNEDGKLELSELKGLVSNDFLKLDTDGDGFLSITELSKSSKFQKRDRKRRRGQRPDVNQLFNELDTNEDGKLSEKEVRGPLSRDFSKIDTNSDGFLTKEELENMPKRQGSRQQRGGRRN